MRWVSWVLVYWIAHVNGSHSNGLLASNLFINDLSFANRPKSFYVHACRAFLIDCLAEHGSTIQHIPDTLT
jgi:hypothetical protein